MRRALLAASLLALAAPARAYEEPDFLPTTRNRSKPDAPKEPQRTDYRSPQRFAFEIKFGPYSPDIDSSPGLRGRPFGELFNSQYHDNGTPNPDYAKERPSGRLLTSFEFDWQIWHGFGSIGVGASVGIMRRTTHGFRYDRVTDAQGTTLEYKQCAFPCERSSDETALGVIPMSLEFVYRFDVLAKRWRIPLVPYFKGGLAYYLWWIESGGGLASGPPRNPNGTQTLPVADSSAIGGTFGLTLRPGLALLLDFIDPGAAQSLDAEVGINHTYLFVEMNYAWITGFGQEGRLVLSDLTWNLGLAFEF